jgi:Flp pilus assembly pilin Flp
LESRRAPLAPQEGEKKMVSFIQKFLRDENGQDLIEYTLLLAFVALASASLFLSAGTSISTIWGSANAQLSNAALSAS